MKNIIKEEYGKTSEVVNAYVNNILQLPTVTSADPNKVNSFYTSSHWKRLEKLRE